MNAAINSIRLSLFLIVSAIVLSAAQLRAQCTEILSDLKEPIGSLLTTQGNLLVAESGDATAGSGRISIVDPSGNRRTLLDGLPSAPADVGDPSGPTGILMRGRTLYVLIGTGDVGIMGPRPGTTLENPNGPSSPIFSSILVVRFSAATENRTTGFTMTAADQEALANGQAVTLSNGGQDTIKIRELVDFPNFIPFPLPDVPDNIAVSNPYGLALIDDSLYVTDGGRNLAWQVHLETGSFSELVSFPDIPNPLFPDLGGPFLQAVPTGIAAVGDQLLVTLLRGAPFPTGTSTVEEIDSENGSDMEFINDLTSAIGIVPFRNHGAPNYLVLEFSSMGPFFSGPGTVLLYTDPTGTPATIADCLIAPSSMTWDRRNGTLYVTEVTGSLIAIPFSN
ncbi:MAG TPA: ScyD/ScyE family protein [Chthoniobacterales bacterium]|jgi:hypothetical protein|nr:ScyD/ScyE family protein [Chthoniobacterales bacterium]